MLPVLYLHDGIGAPLADRQRRFGCASVDDFLELFSAVRGVCASSDRCRVGVAPHSIRAVSEAELRELLRALDELDPGAPVHMHLSEQKAEVEAALASYGQRPGDWLYDRFALNRRWTLIHATQCDPNELAKIARAGATVGLCPLTEAHLGDGRFPLSSFEHVGGRWGIGTDSNTSASVAAELQMLEYSQRLALERRAVHDGADQAAGQVLYEGALEGGRAALDQPVGRLAAGERADLVYFAPDAPALEGHGPDTLLDALFVSGGRAAPEGVMVAGEWLVEGGRHRHEEDIRRRFLDVVHGVRGRLS
jgi:formimidoylglutamate deiminase